MTRDECFDQVEKGRKHCVRIFTHHPRQVGETYCEHFAYATQTGLKLVGLGLISVVHAICPFLFETTVSDHLPVMGDELKSRRPRKQTPTRVAFPTSNNVESVHLDPCDQ